MQGPPWCPGSLHPSTHHLLGHLLRHILVELEEELDGVVVFVLAMQLLRVVHAQPELEPRLDAVILLSQFHMHPRVLLEEGVLQQVLDGVPAGSTAQCGAGSWGRALPPKPPLAPHLSFLSMRMQPSMISFSSGTFTL